MKKEELLKEIQDLDKHIKLLQLKKEELLSKTEALEDLSKFDKLKMWYKHSEHDSKDYHKIINIREESFPLLRSYFKNKRRYRKIYLAEILADAVYEELKFSIDGELIHDYFMDDIEEHELEKYIIESCKDFPNCDDKVNIQSFKDLMVPLLEEAKNGNMKSFDLHW